MTVDEEIGRLAVLLIEGSFEDSPRAQTEWYQGLVEQEDAIRTKLCAKLDDRRVELLEELLDIRAQMEQERELYYLKRGLKRGLEWAIEPSGERLIFS